MCTIQQINSNSYDYVKLHRTSKFFDAEIAKPFPLCVAYDGSFILPAIREYSSLEATLSEYNRIFASILLGGVYIESVEQQDLSRGEMTEVGYFRHVQSFGRNGLLHQELGNKNAGSNDRIKLLDPPTILASEIESAYLYGARILKSIENLSPSLLVTGFTNYINRQTKESLTHSWISIEQLLDHIWHFVVVAESKNEHIHKRSKFLASQQWTAAHKSELLFQKDIISDKTYDNLSSVRDERNKFIHRGTEPSFESANASLSVLVDLLVCACKLRGMDYERNNLDCYLIKRKSKSFQSIIGRVNEIEWSKVQYWKMIHKIPGEEGWEGDFENFEDITLHPINPDSSNG
ncbi:hypothetical protein [Pseudidiomarina sediminum]|nr:hypothetical protein [Pseudidiomarina sediminum]